MTTVDQLVVDGPPPPAAVQGRPLRKIRPRTGWIGVDLHEMWRFRDLLSSLVIRDIKLRYKQTALGVSWVVLQPLVAAGIFSFVFGTLAKMPGDNMMNGKPIPSFVFNFAGLVAWGLFANTVSKISVILVGNSMLVSKVYFPRLLLPLSGAIGVLADAAVAFLMLAVMQLAQGINYGPQAFLILFLTIPILSIALGIGMWAAALCVEYRDVGVILPVFIQFLMWGSAVAYSPSLIDKHPALYLWFYLNPMVSLLSAWRWSVLSTPFPPQWAFWYSVATSLLMLLAGTMFFRRMERTFADVI